MSLRWRTINLKGRDLEWDHAKNVLNVAKHGIDFVEAEEFFAHPILVRRDGRKDYGEKRWIALRKLRGNVTVVVYTLRKERVRIISMRKGNRNERKTCENKMDREAG